MTARQKMDKAAADRERLWARLELEIGRLATAEVHLGVDAPASAWRLHNLYVAKQRSLREREP